jgi:hypothetical protein
MVNTLSFGELSEVQPMGYCRNIFVILVLVGLSHAIVYTFFREPPTSKSDNVGTTDVKLTNNRCTVVFLNKNDDGASIPSNCYRLLLGQGGGLGDVSGNVSHDILRKHLSNESQPVVNIGILAHIDTKLTTLQGIVDVISEGLHPNSSSIIYIGFFFMK